VSERGRFGHHQTLTGKVVYRRKPHLFTTNDAKRVLRGIFLAHDFAVLTAQEEFELDWVEIEAYMLQIVGKQYGLDLGIPQLRLALRRALSSAAALSELITAIELVGIPTAS